MTRHASRHVSDARAVMHVGIANPRWRGKRSRHSRRIRNPQFYVSDKRPMAASNGQLVNIVMWPGMAGDAELCCFFICAWINDWVRNGEAGDLRRHRTHYEVIVICYIKNCYIYINLKHDLLRWIFVVISEHHLINLFSVSKQEMASCYVFNAYLCVFHRSYYKALMRIFRLDLFLLV